MFKDIQKTILKVLELSNKYNIILLSGPMGSGKTYFVKSYMEKIYGFTEVNSPTYTTCNTYITNNNTIDHLDTNRFNKDHLDFDGNRFDKDHDTNRFDKDHLDFDGNIKRLEIKDIKHFATVKHLDFDGNIKRFTTVKHFDFYIKYNPYELSIALEDADIIFIEWWTPEMIHNYTCIEVNCETGDVNIIERTKHN